MTIAEAVSTHGPAPCLASKTFAIEGGVDSPPSEIFRNGHLTPIHSIILSPMKIFKIPIALNDGSLVSHEIWYHLRISL